MRIGVFDSGLGGLLIHRALREALPDHDMVYLGDTLHVPYGKRSQESIFQFTRMCVDYLFRQDCKLVIVACNTASAAALRRLQQEYLPLFYPDRRILGVVVPTLESALESGFKKIGLLGTQYLINSGVYDDELLKIDPQIRIFSSSAPLLVPLIEENGLKWARPVLDEYLAPLRTASVQAIILGCTHYVIVKEMVREALDGKIIVLSQDEIVPDKLKDYLCRHPEIDSVITRNSEDEYCVTEITDNYIKTAHSISKGIGDIRHVVL